MTSRRALAQANFELARLTARIGRNEDALAAHRTVLTAREALAARPGADAAATIDVGRSLNEVASLLESSGKLDEAQAAYRRVESMLVNLAASDLAAKEVLAVSRSRLGDVLITVGKNDDALAVCRLARADQEALSAVPNASSDALLSLANTDYRMARLLSVKGKPAEAELELRTALAIYQKLADIHPGVVDYRAKAASCHYALGLVRYQAGDFPESEAQYRAGMAIYQSLADDHPAVTDFRDKLVTCHGALATVLTDTGKVAEAAAEFHLALAQGQKLVGDHPAVTRFQTVLSIQHANLGSLLAATGKLADAETQLRASVALKQKLADDHPTVTDYPFRLIYSRRELGSILRDGTGPRKRRPNIVRPSTLRRSWPTRTPRFQSTAMYWRWPWALSPTAFAQWAGRPRRGSTPTGPSPWVRRS